jgi:hypothetical protein
LIAATSIFFIVIIASNARFASAPPAAIASVSTREAVHGVRSPGTLTQLNVTSSGAPVCLDAASDRMAAGRTASRRTVNAAPVFGRPFQNNKTILTRKTGRGQFREPLLHNLFAWFVDFFSSNPVDQVRWVDVIHEEL